MGSYLVRLGALFKNASFSCACIMSFFAAIAVGIAYISLSWHLLSIYNSMNAIIVFILTWWIFGTVLSPLTGYFADRFSRRKIILITNWLRVLLILLFLLFSRLDTLAEVYIFSTLWGIVFAFYMPAMLIVVREIFENDKVLMYANSTMDGIFEIGMVVGMSAGGLLVTILNMHQILYVLLVAMVIASVSSAGIYPVRNIDKVEDGFVKSWLQVYRYLQNKRYVMWYYLVQVGFTCLFMTVPAFLAPYAKNILHASSLEFGLIETAFSLGFILGSLFLPWLADQKGEIPVIVYVLIVSSLLYLILALLHNVVLAMLCYFAVGLCISCWAIIVTLAQKHTDIELQGKAQGIAHGSSGLLVMCIYGSFFLLNTVDPLPSNYWFFFTVVLALMVLFPLKKGYQLERRHKHE